MSPIHQLFDTYQQAVFQKDLDAFASIFDDQVQVFDMWHWHYDGLQSWRHMAKEWFASLGSESVAVTFSDLQIQMADEMGSATAFVKFAAVSESGEELRYLQNRLTWVVRKKQGTWKIVHEHTSGPADGQTMKVLLRR